jgi:hypothetical protein
VKRLLSRLAISILAVSFALLLLEVAIRLSYSALPSALQIALRFVHLLAQAIAVFSQGEQTGVLRRLESCPRSCQESSYVSQ